MKKHAFLIMAHGSFDMLRELVGALDDERSDIFIHMDIKARGFEPKYIKSAATLSRVEFLPRMSAHWGGYSLINALSRCSGPRAQPEITPIATCSRGSTCRSNR